MQVHFCEGSEITMVVFFSSPIDAVVPDTSPPLRFISTDHHSEFTADPWNKLHGKEGSSLIGGRGLKF